MYDLLDENGCAETSPNNESRRNPQSSESSSSCISPAGSSSSSTSAMNQSSTHRENDDDNINKQQQQQNSILPETSHPRLQSNSSNASSVLSSQTNLNDNEDGATAAVVDDDNDNSTKTIVKNSGDEKNLSDNDVTMDNNNEESNSSSSSKFPQNVLKFIEQCLAAKQRCLIQSDIYEKFDSLMEQAIHMVENGTDLGDDSCQWFLSATMINFFNSFCFFVHNSSFIDNIEIPIKKSISILCYKLIRLITLCLKRRPYRFLDLMFTLFTSNSLFKNLNEEEYLLNYERSQWYTNNIDEVNIRCDWLNYFGNIGGFECLLSCFQQEDLSTLFFYYYLKPFDNNIVDMLSFKTLETYFLPIIKKVLMFYENLTEDNLKKDLKLNKSDLISEVARYCKNLSSRLSANDLTKAFEFLCLKFTLHVLQFSSFNGKMNALNEINKIISPDEKQYFIQHFSLVTTKDLANWLVENNVLEIMLKDCLHVPQYVEKLDSIIRFLLKENALKLDYLDMIWNSQLGKHEIIVKNVHDLIAKLAWSFSTDELNHLFLCFESSWSTANRKEREKLLELMRRLAEDDNDGSMANKFLTLLWNIAYKDDEIDSDIVDQALSAHLKILDYNKTCDNDSLKITWIERCVKEIIDSNYGNNVITAMKQIKDIFMISGKPKNQTNNKSNISNNMLVNNQQDKNTNCPRRDVVLKIQHDYNFDKILLNNLIKYMEWMRTTVCAQQNIEPHTIRKGRRFSHLQEIQERLDFYKFFLKEGDLWVDISQANLVWICLVQDAIFPSDREICFKWLCSLLWDDDIYLEMAPFADFLEANFFKFDPSLVDIYGVDCFERFFQITNIHKEKLKMYSNKRCLMEDNDLFGLDYLWKLILFSENGAASKAIDFLKNLYTNLGPKLIQSQVELHHDLINTCIDRLRASYDTVSVIEHDHHDGSRVQIELNKMTRVLSVLHEYIKKCDMDFVHERTILPMWQCFRGRPVTLYIKFSNINEEVEVRTHTNETMTLVKKRLSRAAKLNGNCDIEFYNGEEKIDLLTYKFVSQLTDQPTMNLGGRIVNTNTISLCDLPTSNETLPNNDENYLPGVIISKLNNFSDFLFAVADLAMSLSHEPLTSICLSVLKSIPPDVNYVNLIKNFFLDYKNSNYEQFEQKHLLTSPTKTVYLLKIIFILLLPVNQAMSQSNKNFINYNNDESHKFQTAFIVSKYCLKIINYLKDDSFMNKADSYCKICALFLILKISKFTLSTLCCYKMFSNTITRQHSLMQSNPGSLDGLKETIRCVPDDPHLRNVASTVAQNIQKLTFQNNGDGGMFQELDFVPDTKLIESVLMIAWFTGTGECKFDMRTDLNVLNQYYIECHYNGNKQQPNSKSENVFNVCNESIKLSTLMFMLAPQETKIMINKKWNEFFIDLLLLCSEESIRMNMVDQFTIILTKCVKSPEIIASILDMLFILLKKFVPKFYLTSSQFFMFFANILNFSFHNDISLSIINDLLKFEFDLLNNPKENLCFNDQYEETILEGHLKITKELIAFLNPERKYSIGTNRSDQVGLVDLLMDQYLFTASKSLCLLRENEQVFDNIYPVCSLSKSSIAAFELLVALCDGCAKNLSLVAQKLDAYLNMSPISTWEYFPNIIRTLASNRFVGLKNAGGTCYMNSVIQQLYMIPEVRNGILSVMIDDDSYQFDDSNGDSISISVDLKQNNQPEDKKSYNIEILKQIQIIFGHLLLSQCQFYVPKGFWKHFKLFGTPVNLREHQDALEFFNNLYDCLDEAMKALGKERVVANIFGGLFSDQKICKDCPHRYCREESFTSLNVDIRNHHRLKDSLEQYVHGDLLEGDNAYYCENCDRKVNTVKRLCIKKLPKVLIIQLKRFDYDYEHNVPIKFNDYFEFPRTLNMEPYTVDGLARKEGEIIEESLSNSTDNEIYDYELNGIVVHSGQVNGGHYYSFIQHQNKDGRKIWYKFEDIDVSECKLHLDEEMKYWCFGGEFDGSDHPEKKIVKRYWSASLLFYKKVSKTNDDDNPPAPLSMPLPIRKYIQHQNLMLIHQKTMFSEEFYHFMKSLFSCNTKNLDKAQLSKDETLEIAIRTLDIAAKFLFTFCFRIRKSLRRNGIEWYESLIPYIRMDSKVRKWFAQHHIFNDDSNMNILLEFLLLCPSNDVRTAFGKFMLMLYHYAIMEQDELADRIMTDLIKMLRSDIQNNIKHSGQYFHFFFTATQMGVQERRHLLCFNVPEWFMRLATEHYPSSSYNEYYDYKLYKVVSMLVRSCHINDDDSNNNQDDNDQRTMNPFHYEENEKPIMDMPKNIFEILFVKKAYMRIIIKDGITDEDNVKLLKFCCWQNDHFSHDVINELLAHINNSYSYELEYFAVLQDILMMNDSKQEYRLMIAFEGGDLDLSTNMHVAPKGLFEMMNCKSTHLEKQTFECVKLIRYLFLNTNLKAKNVVLHNPVLIIKWYNAIKWLKSELDRKKQTLYYNMINAQTSSWPTSSTDSNKQTAEMLNQAYALLNDAESFSAEEFKRAIEQYNQTSSSSVIEEINNEQTEMIGSSGNIILSGYKPNRYFQQQKQHYSQLYNVGNNNNQNNNNYQQQQDNSSKNIYHGDNNFEDDHTPDEDDSN